MRICIFMYVYICIYYYTHTHTHTIIQYQSIKHLKENEKVFFTRRGEEKKLKLELKNKKHKNVKVCF